MMTDAFVKQLAEEFRKPTPEEVEGRLFVPAGWTELRPHLPYVGTRTVNTLSGLVAYLRENVDELPPESLMVHVVNPSIVQVIGALGEEGKDFRRQHYLTASTELYGTGFPFGRWMGKEEFMIALQVHCEPTDAREQARALLASVRENSVRETADDGVAQKITASAGVALVGEQRVPNPIVLRPYRTFREIAQPASAFVFRLRAGKEEPECVLFEADGGAWKREAVVQIGGYILAELPDVAILA